MIEPINMLFELWTWVGPRNHMLDGVQIPLCEGAILRGKVASPGHAQSCPAVNILKATPEGAAPLW